MLPSRECKKTNAHGQQSKRSRLRNARGWGWPKVDERHVVEPVAIISGRIAVLKAECRRGTSRHKSVTELLPTQSSWTDVRVGVAESRRPIQRYVHSARRAEYTATGGVPNPVGELVLVPYRRSSRL